ncbi:MAG: glycine cleavage T C-terminal barrel domain-containing protein, partial [Gaiellales bacterium]
VDDLIAYRGEDSYLLVVNAANVSADAAALDQADDVSDDWAMLAVQGPDALGAIGVDIEAFTWSEARVLGVDCVVAGTGYTGEEGCELLCAADAVVDLWEEILRRDVVPCGLGARDTLRLEVCYPLHGQDITSDTDPFAAGLGWAVRTEKDFVGVERLREVEREGPAERLVAFEMVDRAIPRPGMTIGGGGTVTSGGYSPMLERGIGLAAVPAAMGEPGTEIVIDVRGKDRRAMVVTKPIYRAKEEGS